MNLKKIFLALIACTGVIFGISNFNQIFPEANIRVTKSKQELLSISDGVAEKLGYKSYSNAMHMMCNSSFLNYARFEMDGVDTVNMVKDRIGYSPYLWKVRYFKEGEIKECFIYLSLDGEVIGIYMKIPEDESIYNIDEKHARKIAIKNVFKMEGNVPKKEEQIYYESEYGFNKQNNGRIDHYFTFENKNKIKDGKLKYNITISGNRLSNIFLSFKEPISFIKKYNDIRANNIKLTYVSYFFVAIFFVLTSLLFFRYLSLKKISTKIASTFSLLIILSYILSFATSFNQNLLYYNTSDNFVLYVIKIILNTLSGNANSFIFMFAAISVGLALDEEAFPNHISLRNLFNKQFLASKNYLNSIYVGYLVGSLDILVAFSFYYIAIKVFGWNAGMSNIDISIYSNSFPAISPFVNAFSAGFFEEIAFRVIPISIGVILAKKYNKKYLVPIFIILQAFVFSAAHANYPAVPYYFRLVELTIPSILFALSYWHFGLITAFVSHFVYDAIIMSESIFDNITFFGLLPAVVFSIMFFMPFFLHIFYRYILKIESKVLLNRDVKHEGDFMTLSMPKLKVNSSSANNFIIPILIFTGLSNISFKKRDNINLTQIESSVESFNKNKGFTAPFSHFSTIGMPPHEFVRENHSDRMEELKNKGILSPLFDYVYKNRENKLSHNIQVTPSGQVVSYSSFYDENISFKDISKDEAKSIAIKEIDSFYNLKSLKVLSEDSWKRVNRTDWVFVFEEDSLIRISAKVINSKVVSLRRYVHVPETFIRENNKIASYRNIISIFSNLISILLIILLGFLSLRCFKILSSKSILLISLSTIAIHTLGFVNSIKITLGSIGFYSNFITSVMNSVISLLISTILAITTYLTYIHFFKSVGINRDIDMDRKIRSSLIFAIGMDWILKVESAIFNWQDLSLFNGASTNVNVFNTIVFDFIKLSIPIVLAIVCANYFKNRIISLLIFFSTTFTLSNNFLISLKYSLIFVGLKTLIVTISYEDGWKYDPSSTFIGILMLLSLSHLGCILSINFAIGYLLAILVISYIIMVFVKKDGIFYSGK